jgi:hypothetical protein
MRVIGALAVAVFLVAAAWLVKVIVEMLTIEGQNRLSLLPSLLLRLAARRVSAALRADLENKWQIELLHIEQQTEGLPVTRLVRGTSFAVGILVSAGGISKALSPKVGANTPADNTLGAIRRRAAPVIGNLLFEMRHAEWWIEAWFNLLFVVGAAFIVMAVFNLESWAWTAVGCLMGVLVLTMLIWRLVEWCGDALLRHSRSRRDL